MDDLEPSSSELTPAERRELRTWLQERREMKAQARILLMMGMGVAGFIGWMWGDHIKIALKKVFA